MYIYICMYVLLYMSPHSFKEENELYSNSLFLCGSCDSRTNFFAGLYIHTKQNLGTRLLSLDSMGASEYFSRRTVSPIQHSFFSFLFSVLALCCNSVCLLTFALPRCPCIHTFANMSLESSFGTCSVQYFMAL